VRGWGSGLVRGWGSLAERSGNRWVKEKFCEALGERYGERFAESG
jgi:hypothetical protein